MVWDIRRLHKKKGDCCGFCCCAEDSCCCCCGKFLSAKQAKFSGLYVEPKRDNYDDSANRQSDIVPLKNHIDAKIDTMNPNRRPSLGS